MARKRGKSSVRVLPLVIILTFGILGREYPPRTPWEENAPRLTPWEVFTPPERWGVFSSHDPTFDVPFNKNANALLALILENLTDSPTCEQEV